ncbi:MAG: hypothetical protein F4Y94_05245, partial [Chloroflexi bacterium]|nr:hypothetical protein [Chloroflexota bacterium]
GVGCRRLVVARASGGDAVVTDPESTAAESPDAGDGWIPTRTTPDGVEEIYLDHVRYERDPLSAVFPDLPDDELDMLAASIKATGQEQPITVDKETGTVLDGWQRLRACHSVRRKPNVQEIEVNDPAAYVMAVNVHRRDVAAKTAVQRVFLAMDLFAVMQDAPIAKSGRLAGRAPTARAIATAAGCGTRTVEQIRQGISYDQNCGTEFEKQMRSGRMSASEVYESIRQLEADDEPSDIHTAKAESREADLSFLDAAEEILRDSESPEPLHYRVITNRALERGLIKTEARSPANTMLKVIYADIRRRDRRREAPRFLPRGNGRIGIAAWAPGGIAALIQERNAEVQRSLLDHAQGMSPVEFEGLVERLLKAMGFDHTEVTPLGGDGGIDVRGTRLLGDSVRIRMAVQAKRWKESNIQRPHVQQVRGSLGAQEQGWIITTSDFSAGAKEEGTRRDATPISLTNGQEFAELLMEHEIGVRRETYDLFTLEEAESEA